MHDGLMATACWRSAPMIGRDHGVGTSHRPCTRGACDSSSARPGGERMEWRMVGQRSRRAPRSRPRRPVWTSVPLCYEDTPLLPSHRVGRCGVIRLCVLYLLHVPVWLPNHRPGFPAFSCQVLGGGARNMGKFAACFFFLGEGGGYLHTRSTVPPAQANPGSDDFMMH